MNNSRQKWLPALALVCVILILATVGTTYAWLTIQVKSGTSQLSWEDESYRLSYKLENMAQTAEDTAEPVASGTLTELAPATLTISQGEYRLTLKAAEKGGCTVTVLDPVNDQTVSSAQLLAEESWSLTVKVAQGQGKLLIQVAPAEALTESAIPQDVILELQADPDATEPEAITEPSQPEASTEPSQPEASTEPSQPEASTEPSQPEASTEPSQPVESTAPQTGETTEPSASEATEEA